MSSSSSSLLPFVEHQIFCNQTTTEVFSGGDSVTEEPAAVWLSAAVAAVRNGVTSLHRVRIFPGWQFAGEEFHTSHTWVTFWSPTSCLALLIRIFTQSISARTSPPVCGRGLAIIRPEPLRLERFLLGVERQAYYRVLTAGKTHSSSHHRYVGGISARCQWFPRSRRRACCRASIFNKLQSVSDAAKEHTHILT